ncbi:MAG: hypothetical protein ACOH13_15745 [Flavobacteriales bacterium]
MPTIPLPGLYDSMQEVDDLELNGSPAPPLHKPYLYMVLGTATNTFSVACASMHGNNQFYGITGVGATPQLWKVTYAHGAASENAGVMLHVHRDKAPIPSKIVMSVDGTDGTPDKDNSDDQSEPKLLAYAFEDPIPLCNVQKIGDHAKAHCLVYLAGMGKVLDVTALSTRRFNKVLDRNGDLVEWLLEIPLTAGVSTAVLHYAAIPLVAQTGTILPGHRMRIRLQAINAATGIGRSYAFIR